MVWIILEQIQFNVVLKLSDATQRRLQPLTRLKYLKIMGKLIKMEHRCIFMHQKTTQESDLAWLSMKKLS